MPSDPSGPPDPVRRFLAISEALPDRPAVVDRDRAWSYAETKALALRLAAAFRGFGDKPRVLIHLPAGAEAYAAMLGSLMAGGVYAPVNVAAPVAKRHRVMEQLDPDLVVGQGTQTAELLVGREEVPVVDPEGLEAMPLDDPVADGSDPAYVIFTSGSTGVPKGVVISRPALAHYLTWVGESMDPGPDDRWSQHPNIGFDLSVLDIYGALCFGATLYPLTPREARLTPAGAIRRHRLTVWDSVPSVLDLMIQARQMDSRHLASLRLMTFCGEPLLPEHLEAIFAARPDLAVHNTYGPTEATVSCTLRRLTADSWRTASGASIAVGDSIGDMTLHLVGGASLDEGEMVLAGPQLAEGYWDDPEATAAAFRPLETDTGSVRGYWTGDWAERRGGELFFKGRRDHQVKIRGHRIELDEVCAALRRCGFGQAHCAVIDGRMHAFLEGRGGDPRAIRDRLADQIEAYALPEHIHFRDRLPRSDNDKIDGRTLVAQYLDSLKEPV